MIKNKSVITKEKNLKFNFDLYRLHMPNPFFWGAVGAFLGVAFFVSGLFLVEYKEFFFWLGAFLLLFSAFLFIMPLIVRINAQRVFKENAKNADTIEFTYIFENELLSITDAEGKVLAQGSYDNLVEAVETEAAFYIMLEPYFGFIVDKDGFIEGDETQLRELLRARINKFNNIIPKDKNAGKDTVN